MLRVSRAYISQLLNGTRKPSDAQIRLLELTLAMKEETEQQKEPGNVREIAPPLNGARLVPVVSYAQAGNVAKDYQDICNQIDEKVETDSKDPNAFAIQIVGDSMEPYASDGDTAVFNPNQEATSSNPALVRLKTGETLFKWFFRRGPHGEVIVLGSENREYPSRGVRADEVEWAYPMHKLIRQKQTRRAQDFIPPEQSSSNGAKRQND